MIKALVWTAHSQPGFDLRETGFDAEPYVAQADEKQIAGIIEAFDFDWRQEQGKIPPRADDPTAWHDFWVSGHPAIDNAFGWYVSQPDCPPELKEFFRQIEERDIGWNVSLDGEGFFRFLLHKKVSMAANSAVDQLLAQG